MKTDKRLKVFVTAIMYIAIYYAVTMAFQLAYALWQNAFGYAAISQISKNLTENVYIISFAAILVSLIIYVKIGQIRGETLETVIKRKKQPLVITFMSLSLAIGMRMLVIVYYSLGQEIGVIKSSMEKAFLITPEISGGFQILIALLSVAVIVPIFEELLFRTIVMNEFLKILRPWAAISVQALLFAIAHGTLYQFCYTLIFGIFLGIIYVRTKSIMQNIVCHATFNFTAFITNTALTNFSSLIIATMGAALIAFSLYYILSNCENQKTVW